jgi:mannose-6-phosphate isomerase-like protein (cupin superfamily)
MSNEPFQRDPRLNEAVQRLESPSAPGSTAKAVRYVKPVMKRPKAIVPLAKSDVMLSAVQVVKDGGETGFHSHTGMDGLWFVLRGRAKFYTGPTDTRGDEVIAECGPHEGVFLPRGVPYWFEKVGDEDLEILQVESFAKGEENKTLFHGPRGGGSNFELFEQDGTAFDLDKVKERL